MLYFLLSILCIIFLIYQDKVLSVFQKKEVFQSKITNYNSIPKKTKPIPNFYLGQSTKCFSCEQQMTNKLKYLGGPTKCFSCEKDLIQRYGHPYGSLGHATKCFSCEKQMGKNPMKPFKYFR